jgi:hypothetical protein
MNNAQRISIIMLIVIMLRVVKASALMLSFDTPNVIILSVIIPCIEAPGVDIIKLFWHNLLTLFLS